MTPSNTESSAPRPESKLLCDAAPWRLDDWEWLDTGSLAAWARISPLPGAAHDPADFRPAMDLAEADATCPPREQLHRRASPLLARLALTAGLLCLVGGGTLLTWSLLAARGELWSWGLACTLAGQTGFLVGIGLQLDGLWFHQRVTSQLLDELDQRVDELRRRTPAGRQR